MLKVKNIKIFLLILLASPFFTVSAFEVNTHQAMTRCALTSTCSNTGQDRSENLHNFIKLDAQLDEEDYSSEVFSGYGWAYLNYAMRGENVFEDFDIGFNHRGNYIDMIEAGVVLEDAVWPSSLFVGDGRFNSHFHDPQQGGKKLGFGSGFRTDAVNWAIDGIILRDGEPRVNQYSLRKAYDYYRNSFITELAKDRKTAQAGLFVSLGHIVHLLQDLHSTAHTRDDSHPEGDPLEVFGREQKGFNLQNGTLFRGEYKDQILADTRAMPAINYSSYRGFFTEEASFVSKNFFSKSTIFPAFTHKHKFPSKDNIAEEIAGPLKTYLNSTLVTPPKLAIRYDGFLYVSHIINGSDDLSVLQDNSRTLMPRAIASTEGFLNYFFRGRMEATVSTNGDSIEIKNISDPTLVASPDLTTFRAGGEFSIYYQTDNEENKFLMDHTLQSDLAEGDRYTITGLSAALATKTDVGTEGKIIVLFDGDIGGERGLVVAHVKAEIFCNGPNQEIWGLKGNTEYSLLIINPEGYDIGSTHGYSTITFQGSGTGYDFKSGVTITSSNSGNILVKFYTNGIYTLGIDWHDDFPGFYHISLTDGSGNFEIMKKEFGIFGNVCMDFS